MTTFHMITPAEAERRARGSLERTARRMAEASRLVTHSGHRYAQTLEFMRGARLGIASANRLGREFWRNSFNMHLEMARAIREGRA